MATKLFSLIPSFGNSEAIYTKEAQEVKEEVSQLEREIESLKKISTKCVFLTGQLDTAAQPTKNLLNHPSVQPFMPEELISTCDDVLSFDLLKQLLLIAEQTETGDIIENMEEPISQLNQQTGAINAKTKKLQEEIEKMSKLIGQFEQLNLSTVNTIETAQNLSKRVDQYLEKR